MPAYVSNVLGKIVKKFRVLNCRRPTKGDRMKVLLEVLILCIDYCFRSLKKITPG